MLLEIEKMKRENEAFVLTIARRELDVKSNQAQIDSLTNSIKQSMQDCLERKKAIESMHSKIR